MINLSNFIKALSLECLAPQSVKDTSRNSEIFREIESLDVEYGTANAAQKVDILARIFDLCIIMDVI